MSKLETIKKEYILGIEFLNKFTLDNIIDILKPIIEKYIYDENSLSELNDTIDIKLEVSHHTIKYIDFCFGKVWGLYHVTISPFYLNITQQEGHSNFTKHIINIKTCIL